MYTVVCAVCVCMCVCVYVCVCVCVVYGKMHNMYTTDIDVHISTCLAASMNGMNKKSSSCKLMHTKHKMEIYFIAALCTGYPGNQQMPNIVIHPCIYLGWKLYNLKRMVC